MQKRIDQHRTSKLKLRLYDSLADAFTIRNIAVGLIVAHLLAIPLCLGAQPVEVAVALSHTEPFPAGKRERVAVGPPHLNRTAPFYLLDWG